MSKSHNKKRNTGLLYEFLVRTISSSLVEENKKRSSTALKLLRKHFKPGTELYREFRLINSLVKTTVSSEAVAASIIQEAKRAARSYNPANLDREKSLLIRNINHGLQDSNFYDQPITEYLQYATIQTLINDWRSSSTDLRRIAQYEEQLLRWLTTDKQSEPEQTLSEESTGTSRLLMKVMMKKLNEKYSRLLNAEQKELIRAYAFSTANDDSTSIRKKLEEIRERLLKEIEGFEFSKNDYKFVGSKLLEVKEQLLAEDVNAVNDDIVTRFMLYTQLESELKSEET